MRRATQCQAGESRSNRAIASLALCLFCFQLARFYLVVPLDAYTCYSPDHVHGGSASEAHYHGQESYDGDHREETLPQSDDHGYYFQHCKDTLNGLGLAPIELLGVPARLLDQSRATQWGCIAELSSNPTEINLPPPFQPPRTRS